MIVIPGSHVIEYLHGRPLSRPVIQIYVAIILCKLI